MKTGKKTLAVLLAFIMLLTAVPLQAAATEPATATKFAVDSTSARPGSDVDVQITIQNNPGILGATLTLRYDSKLTLTAAKAGDAFSPLSMTKPGQFASPCQFIWDGESLASGDIKDGTVLTLTFHVAEDAASGSELPVRISYVPGDLIDKDLKSVSAEIVNGSVTVINFTPGDVNEDGHINTTDIISLRRFLSGGYGQVINQTAADVNDDGKLNTLDIILIRRFIAGGYGVTLQASHGVCVHSLEAFAAVPATCTDNGNIAYWHCVICGRYFSDEDGGNEIQLTDAIIKPFGHTPVVDPAVPATYTSSGLTEGSHCSVCGLVIVQPQVIPALQPKEHMISYDIANGDPYLATLLSNGEIENTNPNRYSEETGIAQFTPLVVDGYRFLGWFDGAGNGAEQVKMISSGTKDNVYLYAHWEKVVYTVQFKSSIYLEEKQISYTVDTGVVLPTPKLSNYVFTGWSDEEGRLYPNKIIPAGTTENIILTANWSSERNKTFTKTTLDAPIVHVDEEKNVILLAYEIGEIQNVPLYVIHDFGYIAGDGVTKKSTETYSVTISEATMQSYTQAVSNATTQSSNWTLSKDWNERTDVSSQWCQEHGKTEEEARTIGRSSTDTWNISSGSSGSKDTTKLETNQSGLQQERKINAGGEVSVSGKYSVGLNAEVGGSLGVVDGKAGVSQSVELEAGLSLNAGVEAGKTVDTSKLKTESTTTSSGWNRSSSYSGSNTTSESDSTSTALTEKISSAYGYGKSYLIGGSSSTMQGLTASQSASEEYSSSVTYTRSTSSTVTNSWETQATKPGYHRWVVAGTAHVFGVVGYDMSSKSYFVYTCSIIDDETHEFEDYSYNSSNYDDEQNGVISFEIPYDVVNYVAELTSCSQGLRINQETGTITGYSGTDPYVVIPEYMNVGDGKVIKVTGISPTAFSGNKNITFVQLSDFITSIPDHAFEGCSSLLGINGKSITSIGDYAFSGCTSIDIFNLNSKVTMLGIKAFENVACLQISAANPNVAVAAAASGAKVVRLFIQNTDSSVSAFDGKSLDVPAETQCFELYGSKHTYNNLKIKSNAGKTVINEASFISTDGIPVQISSSEAAFNSVTVLATGIAMVLSASDTNVGLQGTITVQSDNANALLCKNITLYEINPQVDGKLAVIRKVLTCGEITNEKFMTYNEKAKIDEDTFNNLLNSYTLYFDANGGSCSETSRKVPNSTPIGELPTPTRAYYTFVGWYLSDGTAVTKDTVFTTGVDQTLYAHWDENPLVGWVKASDVPAGAEIVNRKWTYTQTSYTTSSSPTLNGWTQYNSTSAWSDYGAWSDWTTNAVSGSDSRQVQTDNRHTGYNMIVYNTMSTGGKRQFRSFSIAGSYSAYGCSSSYGEYNYSMWASVDTLNAAATVAEGAYTSACSYPGYNKGSGTGYILDYYGSLYVFFVSNYTYTMYYRYRDRSLVYTYYFYKTEQKESASTPSGENISDVQEWVMYRAK